MFVDIIYIIYRNVKSIRSIAKISFSVTGQIETSYRGIIPLFQRGKSFFTYGKRTHRITDLILLWHFHGCGNASLSGHILYESQRCDII